MPRIDVFRLWTVICSPLSQSARSVDLFYISSNSFCLTPPLSVRLPPAIVQIFGGFFQKILACRSLFCNRLWYLCVSYFSVEYFVNVWKFVRKFRIFSYCVDYLQRRALAFFVDTTIAFCTGQKGPSRFVLSGCFFLIFRQPQKAYSHLSYLHVKAYKVTNALISLLFANKTLSRYSIRIRKTRKMKKQCRNVQQMQHFFHLRQATTC